MPKLAEKILEIRKQNDLTQDDFAEKLGVSRQSVSKWEIGQAVPRNSTINKMCKEFDIPKGELLGEKYNDNYNINIKKKKKQFYKTLTIVLISLTILFLSCVYRLYSFYKYCILTDITNKVSQYEYLDNYYCKVEEYLNDKVKSRVEIWYKDGIYKIKTQNYNNSENLIYQGLKWIDCNNGIRTQYDYNTNKIEKYKQYIEENKQDVIQQSYINGKYMYTFFPNSIRQTKEEILNKALKFNIIYIKYLPEENHLKINDSDTFLNKEYLPISYQKIIGNDLKSIQYNIVINNVTDEDVEIKEDL